MTSISGGQPQEGISRISMDQNAGISSARDALSFDKPLGDVKALGLGEQLDKASLTIVQNNSKKLKKELADLRSSLPATLEPFSLIDHLLTSPVMFICNDNKPVMDGLAAIESLKNKRK